MYMVNISNTPAVDLINRSINVSRCWAASSVVVKHVLVINHSLLSLRSTGELVGKGHHIGGESFGIFPVKRVPCARVNQQMRACDGFSEGFLIAARTVGILIAPGNQCGRFDFVKLH